jgi:hypothetical protein
VPTVVLIREPTEVIASLLAWESSLKIQVALKAYMTFYRKLMPYTMNILVVAFEDVISKPVDVVKAFNVRFDTHFNLPEYTDEELKNIKKGIRNKKVATASPIPTPEKEKAKEEIRQLIKDEPTLSDAIRVYKEFNKHRHLF